MTTKIECPSCGQHYSVELGDEEITVTCQKCQATFTAEKEPEGAPVAKDRRSPNRQHSARPSLANPPAANPHPRPGLLDRFMGLLFRFGKGFAGILALVFLVGILISGIVFLTHLRTSLEVPDYRDLTRESSSESSDGESGLDRRRILEKRFGDRLADLIKDHKLNESAYDAFLEMLGQVEEDHREAYLDGLEDALDDREKASRRDPDATMDATDLLIRYSTAFAMAEMESSAKAAEAKTTRLTALGAATASCFMLFLMLIIPALLRIEENTRRG